MAAACCESKLVQGRVQVRRRVQIVLKQKLHGAFTRFTSFSHTHTMPQKPWPRNHNLAL